MTLQVTEPEYCKLDVMYQADPSLVKTKRAQAIKALQKDKSIRLPGFRPGKASKEAIQFYMKNQLKDWTTKELTKSAYEDLIYEQKIKTVYYPQVTSSELNKDEFWCNMTVLKKPSFELKQYKGFDIPKPVVETIDQAAASAIENLRQQHSEFQIFEDSDVIGDGDKLTMDMKIYVDGELVDSKEGFLYDVGTMPEIDPHLIGIKLGESRTFEENCPDNFPTAACRGKQAKFEISVFMGLKTHPASLDELPSKFKMSSFEEFHGAIKAMVTNKLEEQYQNLMNQQIITRLLEQHDFKVPDFMIDMELNKMLQERQLKSDMLNEEQTKAWKDVAEKNVKIECILDSVRDQEPDTFYTDEELLRGLQNKIITSGQDPKVFMEQAQKTGQLLPLLGKLKNQLLLDFIAKNCNIIE